MTKINVKSAIKIYGERLIGKQIMTYPEGDYPGGLAIVTDMSLDGTGDELCPIHMNVKNIYKENGGSMGILYYEDIGIEDDVAAVLAKEIINV